MKSERGVLFEISRIVIVGLLVALAITAAMRYFHKPTVQEFVAQYTAADSVAKEAVAEKYLRLFPAPQLLKALEQSDTTSVCHVRAHAFGRAVYKLNSNLSEAIKQCGNSCTYGCFHGVLMGMFSTDSDTLGGVIEEQSPDEYLAHVQHLAKDLCTQPDVQSVVRLRYCYHGLGHVFSFMTGENIQKAVQSCDVLAQSNARASCQSGAFMEYLFSTSSAKIMFSKDAALCDAYSGRTVEDCYRYKAFGWLEAYGGAMPAMTACRTIAKSPLICIRSVAQAASVQNVTETDAQFIALCGALTGDEHSYCIQGALRTIIELNDGDDSDHTCDAVGDRYRGYCVQYVHAYLQDTFQGR